MKISIKVLPDTSLKKVRGGKVDRQEFILPNGKRKFMPATKGTTMHAPFTPVPIKK
ncbi:hypothetical protein SCG7086_AB_00090 [Chlamydiales bacterium SCGC AG-110-P3]|nr:hypothetical protein SCG7086_AB_00090 [Chlamydiales bacterium SCGC AG-110-P3]